jgi:Fe-S-cluster containining protein
MDLENKCFNCAASCCRLTVDVSKEEYQIFKNKGLNKHFITQTDKYISKNPKHENKRPFIDSLYIESYAELKKDKSGLCALLDKNTLLCTIYEDRPQACKDYQINSKSCKKLYKCIS